MRLAAGATRRPLLAWDRRAVAGIDGFIANSTETASRLREAYGVEAPVVPPPVLVDPHGVQEPVPGVDPGFALVVARLIAYKHVDVVVEAFARRPHDRLVVVGDGPEADRIRALAGPGTTILGMVDEPQLRWLYAHARVLVSAAYEDFGMTPAEAGAFGCPVAVLRHGGHLDTVVEGASGTFFDTLEPGAVSEAVDRVDAAAWSTEALQAHAATFNEAAFTDRLRSLAADLVGTDALGPGPDPLHQPGAVAIGPLPRRAPRGSSPMAVIDRTSLGGGGGAPPPGTVRKVRLPELDVIRVLASIEVVLWHLTFSGWAMADAAHTVKFSATSQIIRYGYFVPQLFFMVSGLVIMGAIQNATPWGFFRGRVIRVVPLFWLLCTITWVVSRNHHHFEPLTWQAYLLNMSFLTSIAGGPFIDAVYWTLTVELFFYGTIWLAMCSGQLHRLRTLLLGWLVVGGIVELLTLHADGALGHFGFLMRWNCCFAIGILCWMLQQDRRDRFAWAMLPLCSLLAFRAVWLVAQEFGAYLQPGQHLHPWVGAVAIQLCVVLMVALALKGPTGWVSDRAAKHWAFAGALTYPVYLFHENVGLVAMDRFHWVNKWLLVSVVFACVVAFAWLATEFWEKPVIAWLKRRIPAQRPARRTSTPPPDVPPAALPPAA
ncbi:glycosyltransferase [Aquihabitans sp. G128]|uniref:glycosyltransferase n=1 Tax=Aquihabitans sp. G128 TaxID=2849779 RepID=UPI001C228088|nr:glycosyltransferase [Aquihabitans sp. G128]QXC62950.1 glycosyltransferase [Aquihabitans sp. G128]